MVSNYTGHFMDLDVLLLVIQLYQYIACAVVQCMEELASGL